MHEWMNKNCEADLEVMPFQVKVFLSILIDELYKGIICTFGGLWLAFNRKKDHAKEHVAIGQRG